MHCPTCEAPTKTRDGWYACTRCDQTGRVPLIDNVIRAEIVEENGAVWVELRGGDTWRHGPFDGPAAAEAARTDIFRAWRRRAQELGGTAVRPTQRAFIVALPLGVEGPGVEGGVDWG